MRKKIFALVQLLQALFYGSNKFMQNMNSFLASKEVKSFYENNLNWPKDIELLLKKKHPRVDRFILRRNPKLKFEAGNNRNKILIDAMYSPEEEIREDFTPYIHFGKALIETLNISETDTVIDIGCTSGNLIYALKNQVSCEVSGIEYFEFLKRASHESIYDSIYLADLRLPIDVNLVKPANIVICTEVGEHIDPKFLDEFLTNIRNLTISKLVISWSSTFPPPQAPPQHLSVLTPNQLKKILTHYGFIQNQELSKLLYRKVSSGLQSNHHWLDSLTVWDKND